tara:strand:- start:1776 stop:2363 length:588 start_codon:yes stop_codon:yes gene_type:complete
VFAGDGLEYPARVENVSHDRVIATVYDSVRQEPPPTPEVEVWCANVRVKRMEWAIEKCVEAGVNVFRPINTEHSARGKELSLGRHDRWRRIAVEAAEQCGRLYLPVITPVLSFEETLKGWTGTLVIAHQEGRPWFDITAKLPKHAPLAVAVGPEGGFSTVEIEAATQAGALVASLGPNTLRTETAAVVAVALARS